VPRVWEKFEEKLKSIWKNLGKKIKERENG
jgi:hypothetical protein